MAEAVLREDLGPEAAAIEIVSAGTSAVEGQPASAGAREAAEKAGLDLSGHRSRRATAALLREADLVLVMEREHARAAAALGADPSKVHVLSEWPAPGEPDLAVADPFGGSSEAYEEALRRIRRHVRRIVPALRELARRPA